MAFSADLLPCQESREWNMPGLFTKWLLVEWLKRKLLGFRPLRLPELGLPKILSPVLTLK
jgi:hypothetical protein